MMNQIQSSELMDSGPPNKKPKIGGGGGGGGNTNNVLHMNGGGMGLTSQISESTGK